MHEFSLVRSLLRQIDELVRSEGASAVSAVAVAVGDFSGVDAELLRLAFEQLSAGSRADSAQLTVRSLPLEARCERCGREFAVERFQFACPYCRHADVVIVHGEELLLESITLELADA